MSSCHIHGMLSRFETGLRIITNKYDENNVTDSKNSKLGKGKLGTEKQGTGKFAMNTVLPKHTIIE